MTQRAENPVNLRSPEVDAATVSVVVPCRNERPYIDETMRSILAQQNLPDGFEVIVVDGRSDDGTRERLGELQSTYPNLRVLDNDHQTTAYGMNLGIESATGDGTTTSSTDSSARGAADLAIGRFIRGS